MPAAVQLHAVMDLAQILKDHNGSVLEAVAHTAVTLIQAAGQPAPMNAFPDQKDAGEAIPIKPAAIIILMAALTGLVQ